jgi:hypothetical protein
MSLSLSPDEQNELLLKKYMNLTDENSSKEKIKNLMRKVTAKQSQKHTLARLPSLLNGNSGDEPALLGTKLYTLYLEANKPAPVLIDKASNVDLYSKASFFHASSGKTLSHFYEDFASTFQYI